MSLTYEDLQIPDGRSEVIRDALDSVLAATGSGPLSTAISDTFYGLNHRKQPNAIPINRDDYGLTFFTRPRLNLTSNNLRQIRQFTPMLSTNSLSLPRAIRAMLDTDCRIHGHTSPVVDEYQAFIPILTNQLISMSGWPDVIAPVFTSKPGVYKESYSHVDGITNNYESYSLRATFRNLQGDPITALFLTWVHYSSLVFQGLIVPYPDMIIENEIDYQTRIYRLVLDPSRRFIQKIAATAASFPVDVPIAASFNFETDTPLNQANAQISVNFQTTGAMYQDPILIDEFNKTVIMHNSDMGGTDADRQQNYVLLQPDLYNVFNHRGYPRIHPDTWELQWWIRREEYDEIVLDDNETTIG